MKKSALLAWMLIVVGVVVVNYLRQSQKAWKAGEEHGADSRKPEDVVWAMFDAARAGEVERYLCCFTGKLHEQLARTVREMGKDAMRRYLKRTDHRILGIAVQREEKRSASEKGEVAFVVELVFKRYKEVQHYHVILEGGEWKIYGVDSSQRVPSLIPYGTPVEKF